MDVNALVKKVTGGAQGAHGTLSTVMGVMGGQDHTGFNNMLSSLTSGGLGDQVKSVDQHQRQSGDQQPAGGQLAWQRQAKPGGPLGGLEPE